MINEKIRGILPEESTLFENPSFDNSIIGVSYDDRVVYDYNSMILEFIADEGDDKVTVEDAVDFIDYNTIRSLSYFNHPNKPIIIFPLESFE